MAELKLTVVKFRPQTSVTEEVSHFVLPVVGWVVVVRDFICDSYVRYSAQVL